MGASIRCALFTRAFERMQTFRHLCALVEPVRGDGLRVLGDHFRIRAPGDAYRIKAIGAFVVGIGFIAMGAASLLPYRYQTAEPLVPALNSYWIYIHVSVTLTSYAAFAMAGGLGVMYFFKERAERAWEVSRVSMPPFRISRPSMNLGYKAIMVGFPLLAFGIILGAMWANYAWGGYWSWDPKETWSLIVWLIYGAYIHARMTRGWEGRRAAIYAVFGFLDGHLLFLGREFLAVRSARLCLVGR